jgi:hypothetical protein
VIANVAIPTTLALLAQVRDKLLLAAEPFAPLRVEGERARLEMIRISVDTHSDEERLVARVTHLQEILAWVDELPSPADQEDHRAWQTLVAARQLAHKVLADQENPKAGDRTRSAVEPEVRRGKHGEWYDGYLLDVMIDADSELITALDVLPANGDEAANAVELVRQEEAAQGNEIEALSIDKIGFQAWFKNEYEAEYRRMRRKAQTSRYAAVRKEHPKIERKLADLVRRHGARRARYRGRWKILRGQLLAATAANVKRIVHLLRNPNLTAPLPV